MSFISKLGERQDFQETGDLDTQPKIRGCVPLKFRVTWSTMYGNDEDFYRGDTREPVSPWRIYRPAVELLSVMALILTFGAATSSFSPQTVDIAAATHNTQVIATSPAPGPLPAQVVAAVNETATTNVPDLPVDETTVVPTPPPERSTSTTIYEANPEVEQMICTTFGDQCQKALDVAHCESRFVTTTVGDLGERGVFQIHPVHIPYLQERGMTWDSMFDVSANIAYAYDLYGRAGWGPWSCA